MTRKKSQKGQEISEEYRTLLNEYRNQLIDNINSSQDEYDKHIIQLSTATIGVSLVLITDVAGLDISNSPGLLYSSWFFSVIAILAVVFSFRLSASENNRLVDELDANIKKGIIDEEEENNTKKTSYVALANNASGACFTLALISLLLFAFSSINNPPIPKEKNVSTTSATAKQRNDGTQRSATNAAATNATETTKEQIEGERDKSNEQRK